MSDLSKPVENPQADVLHYELLSTQQHIINNPELYPDWEQRVADLYVLLDAMEAGR